METGSIFYNTSENGETYMNLVFDPVLVDKMDVLKGLKFPVKEIPLENRSENSPIYKVFAYKPKEK